jgi:hypothetical protein
MSNAHISEINYFAHQHSFAWTIPGVYDVGRFRDAWHPVL